MSAPSWIGPSTPWAALEIGGHRFGPPDCTVHLSAVGLELLRQNQKAAGKDRGPVAFRGIETPQVTAEIRVWTKAGEDLLRLAGERCLIPQKDPGKRQHYPVKHPSLQALRMRYAAVIKYSEELQRDHLLVRLVLTVSEHGASKSKASGKPKAKVEVAAIDLGTGRKPRDLRDVAKRPSSQVSTK